MNFIQYVTQYNLLHSIYYIIYYIIYKYDLLHNQSIGLMGRAFSNSPGVQFQVV